MKEAFKKFIEKAVDYNAEVLEIMKPRINYVIKDSMGTVTTKAETSSDGDEIKINRDIEWGGEFWKERAFSTVSHELRHCWQMQTRYNDEAIKKYKSSSSIGLQRYNEQELEIDAWAWAWFMLKVNFGLDLVFESDAVSLKAQETIKVREKEIEGEFLKKRN